MRHIYTYTYVCISKLNIYSFLQIILSNILSVYVKLPFFFLSFFLPRIIQILIFYKSIIFQVNKFVYIYIRSYGVVNTNTERRREKSAF